MLVGLVSARHPDLCRAICGYPGIGSAEATPLLEALDYKEGAVEGFPNLRALTRVTPAPRPACRPATEQHESFIDGLSNNLTDFGGDCDPTLFLQSRAFALRR